MEWNKYYSKLIPAIVHWVRVANFTSFRFPLVFLFLFIYQILS